MFRRQVDPTNTATPEAPSTRFLGIQMDIAVLILGAILLLAIAAGVIGSV